MNCIFCDKENCSHILKKKFWDRKICKVNNNNYMSEWLYSFKLKISETEWTIIVNKYNTRLYNPNLGYGYPCEFMISESLDEEYVKPKRFKELKAKLSTIIHFQ